MTESTSQKNTATPSSGNIVKYIIAAAIILGFVAFILFFPQEGGRRGPLLEGQPAPDFSLKDINGKTWTLSSFTNSVVVVNFWASWCPPCKEELPDLYTLDKETIENPNFTVVPILYQDDPETAKSFLESQGFGDFPIVLDPDSSVARAFGVTGVPETFVIDKKGILRKKHIGAYRFISADAVKLFNSLMQE